MPDRGQHGRIAVLARERDRRVAGQGADPDEDEHAREHEDDQGGSQPAKQEAAHVASVPYFVPVVLKPA